MTMEEKLSLVVYEAAEKGIITEPEKKSLLKHISERNRSYPQLKAKLVIIEKAKKMYSKEIERWKKKPDKKDLVVINNDKIQSIDAAMPDMTKISNIAINDSSALIGDQVFPTVVKFSNFLKNKYCDLTIKVWYLLLITVCVKEVYVTPDDKIIKTLRKMIEFTLSVFDENDRKYQKKRCDKLIKKLDKAEEKMKNEQNNLKEKRGD